MAEKVSVYDFVGWCTRQIEPAKLSALMSKYGYTDDSPETIMIALTDRPLFRTEFGYLLGEAIGENQKEISRAIGGINVSDSDMTHEHWGHILSTQKLSLATGDEKDSGDGLDWNALIAGVLGTASSIWGKGNTTDTAQNTKSPTTGSGSSTAVWIIIGVVLVVIAVILWLSLAGKK